jgi:hypothetical protein
MAVDTRNKRASCVNVALPFGRVFASPDGTLDESDRRQMGGCYAGIEAAEPSPEMDTVLLLLVLKRRHVHQQRGR